MILSRETMQQANDDGDPEKLADFSGGDDAATTSWAKSAL